MTDEMVLTPEMRPYLSKVRVLHQGAGPGRCVHGLRRGSFAIELNVHAPYGDDSVLQILNDVSAPSLSTISRQRLYARTQAERYR
jgi:hypothetical protein